MIGINDLAEVLSRLDIRAEFERRGGKIIPGKVASDAGWLEVFAIDRTEKTPGSAALNVGQGKLRGRYSDQARDNRSMGFFALMAEMAPGEFPTFGDAIRHYRVQTGIAGGGRMIASGKEEPIPAHVETPPDSAGPVAEDMPTSGGSDSPDVQPLQPRKRRLVARYEYLDAIGRHVQQVARWEPKAFSQSHKGSDGKWIKRAPPASRRVLYHLDLIAKAPADRLIYVCEGEKDADNLLQISRGHCLATTAPGGAAAGKSTRKWLPQFTESLRGRRVVIIPDSDSPGQQHAQHVAECLHGVAALVTILDLPLPPSIDPSRKWDLTDWIQATGAEAQRSFGLAVAAALEAPWTPPEAMPTETVDNRQHMEDSDVNEQVSQTPLPKGDTIANHYYLDEDVIELSMEQIVCNARRLTGDWPRNAGGMLFHDHHRKCRFIEKQSDLWALWGELVGRPANIRSGSGLHTKEEIFSAWKANAFEYDTVDEIPHVPPVSNAYYFSTLPDLGDGSVLAQVLDRLNPASEADAVLLRAAFVTPLWGGPGGARPAFVITSDSGRGAGKTTVVKLIARIFGGLIALGANDDGAKIKERLLSPNGRRKRIVLLDNVKTHRFSWADLEDLITSDQVSGKQLWVGEATRPNRLSYFITVNGVAMSTDLAQRSVVIKLCPPKRDGGFEEEISSFIQNHRSQLLGDIAAILNDPETEIPRPSRWATWEKQVLSKLFGAVDAQKIYLERQTAVDVERDEAEAIEDEFRQKLSAVGYVPEAQLVFIPSKIAWHWFKESTGETRITQTASSRAIHQMISENRTRYLIENRCNTRGRGFIWRGLGCDPNQEVDLNLDARIVQHSNRTGVPHFLDHWE
jgi:hypothetical protein